MAERYRGFVRVLCASRFGFVCNCPAPSTQMQPATAAWNGSPSRGIFLLAPIAGPVDRDFDVSATRVSVATDDAVDAIGRDLSEASVFIPDPEGGKGGRIVIATTNADRAEAPRPDGQVLDVVCPPRPHRPVGSGRTSGSSPNRPRGNSRHSRTAADDSHAASSTSRT